MNKEIRNVSEDVTLYDRYYIGRWWTPTGYEVKQEDGLWWPEYEDSDGNLTYLR